MLRRPQPQEVGECGREIDHAHQPVPLPVPLVTDSNARPAKNAAGEIGEMAGFRGRNLRTVQRLSAGPGGRPVEGRTPPVPSIEGEHDITVFGPPVADDLTVLEFQGERDRLLSGPGVAPAQEGVDDRLLDLLVPFGGHDAHRLAPLEVYIDFRPAVSL